MSSPVELDELQERRNCVLDSLERLGLERAQAICQPRRPASSHTAHEPLALTGQPEPDAPTVAGRAHALEERGSLEPIDMTGHRRRRDALLGRELSQREAGAALHEPQKRGLP